MTIIFEHREVKKKLLLIQFRFNGCTVKVKRNHVEGYTLDKYLTLDTWSQIYTKLTNTIDVYAANDTIKPDPSSIKMTRAQLSLRVSWSAVDPMHRQLADASDVDVAQLCPMVMNVDVTMLSLIDKYKTVRQSEKKPEPGASSTVSASNSTSSIASADSALSAASAASSAPKSTAAKKTTTRTYSNLKLAGSIDDDEEYVPTANATAANGVQYTPSTVNAASDEYMPPTSAEVDVVTYTPTKITKSRSDEGASRRAPAASHSTTDLNRNDCVNKRSRPPSKVDAMADLFGDSEDEVARCTRSAKKTTRGDGVTQRKRPNGGPASVKTQSNLSNWLGIKEEPKKRRIEANGAADAPPKTANSDATEWERLKSISDKLDRKIESSRRTVEALNLTHFTPNKMVATFNAHRTMLGNLFEAHKDSPQYAFPKLGYDPTKFLQLLLTADQQTAMVSRMKEHFCPDEEYGVTSFSNLLWDIMLPEWALQRFMLVHDLERANAIEHLNIQNDVAAADLTFDLSSMLPDFT